MKAQRGNALKIEIEQFLNIAGIMFVALDSEGNVDLINQKGCDILGYTQNEIIGSNWFDTFVSEDIRADVHSVFNRLIEGEIEPTEYYHTPIITKDGERRTIAWHNTVLRNEDGGIVGTLSSGEDVTGKELRVVKIEHLNLILQTIRKINRLIVVESDRDRLLKGICENLVELPGYQAAWIILLDDSGICAAGTEAGFGKPFASLMERLKRGEMPVCVEKAIKEDGAYTIEDTSVTCGDCPLAGGNEGYSSRSIRLEHDGTIYGLLNATCAPDLVADYEEQSLFKVLAEDIAFALYNMERADELEGSLETIKALSTVVEQSVEGMAIAELDGTLTFVNDAWCEMHGYQNSEELIGSHLSLFHTKEQNENEVLPFNEKVRKHGTHSGEVGHVTRDGRSFLTSMATTLLKDERGNPFAMAGTARDITRKKQIDQELRAERNKLKQIFEAMVDGVYIANPDYDIEYVNPVLIADFGPYENRKCYTYFHDREDVCPWCRNKEVQAGKTVHWEWYSSKNDRTYDLIDSPLYNADGSISKLEIFRDITERKEAEVELLLKNQVFESSLTANSTLDDKGILTHVNAAFCRCWGYESEEEAVGKPISDFLASEVEATRIITTLNDFGEWEGEYAALKKDGTTFSAHALATVIRNVSGDIVGYQSSVLDITDQKQLEDQFRQAQKMEAIGRLAGGIAHDFNNILTVISGNVELILGDLPDESPYRNRILNIKKAGTHAAGLTQQLLAFSRKQIAEPHVFDINDTISGLMSILHRVIGEDIKLTFMPGEDVGNIYMDQEQLTQVLMNLFVNAREAMPRGGTLVIETEQVEIDEHYINTHSYITPGLYARLAITDTGTGMSDEIIDQVFEPFYTTKESGTGLGLSTVFGIVKQNGGAINVYSEKGIGTTFKIYLPITRERAEADPTEAGEADLPTGSETILLVEDEDTVRELAAEVLTNLGYEVHDYAEAKEALLFAGDRKGTIDLLLTDVVMPGMDGPKLAKDVQESYPSVRVLYMSGYTDNAIAHHGILHEGVNLLQKPFTLVGIAKKVREVLDADLSD